MHTHKTQQKALINIFISYAREDKKHCEELVKQLNPVASIIPTDSNIKLLDLWYDDYLLGGDVWHEKIRRQLESADIILLLISKDFLNSEYCTNVELKQAMEMHKANKLRIVPIIIGKCKWKSTFLEALTALPKDELLPFEHSNPDLFYTNVATEIEAIAKAYIDTPPPPPSWLEKLYKWLKKSYTSFKKPIIIPRPLKALLATIFFASALLIIINYFQPEEYESTLKRSSCVNSNITNEVLTTYLEQGTYGECRHNMTEADTDTDLKKMVSAAELLYEINAKNINAIQHSVENAKPTHEQFMPLYQQVRGTLYLYKGLYQSSNYLNNALTDFKTAHENYKKQNLIYSEQMALALQAGSCSRPAALSEDSEKILIGEVGSLIRKQINKSFENDTAYFDSLNMQLPWQKERPEAEKEHINLKLTQCVDIKPPSNTFLTYLIRPSQIYQDIITLFDN